MQHFDQTNDLGTIEILIICLHTKIWRVHIYFSIDMNCELTQIHKSQLISQIIFCLCLE